jgi:transcriptional regulator with XRE-family HTH domain
MQNLNTNEAFNKLFISENLKRLRLSYNLSTTEVGKIIGKTRQGYLNYENGSREIGIYDLITLSGFYNVSIDVIVANPFTLRNEKLLAFRTFEYIDSALKEVMPITISTVHDDVICVKVTELRLDFFWKTNSNQKGHDMLFEYFNKPYISKVYYNSAGGGHFYINNEPYYFNKAQSESIVFKGVFISELNKITDIPHFF